MSCSFPVERSLSRSQARPSALSLDRTISRARANEKRILGTLHSGPRRLRSDEASVRRRGLVLLHNAKLDQLFRQFAPPFDSHRAQPQLLRLVGLDERLLRLGGGGHG